MTARGPVLATGGTGFVGTHVIARLLRDGWAVRTTVRSPDRAGEVREAVGGDPEFAVATLDSDVGWAEAVDGCAYVLHVASPFPADDPADEDEVIRPARDGAVRVLRAARDAGVRRVVLTSSFAAVGYSGTTRGFYDETDWTDPADDNTAYVKSKAVAERAAWDFACEGGPELAVINPTGIFGPVLSPRLSTSTGLIKAMLEGTMPVVPRSYFGVVDVRDVADAHVRAMTAPSAAGERFLVSSGPAMSFTQIAELLGVPVREAPGEAEVPVIRTDKARNVLGWEPRDQRTTIRETAESLRRSGLLGG
ncbi:SDR family oxidoreductase [Amycolatopsis thermoflava]